MTADERNGTFSFVYDHRNLPLQVNVGGVTVKYGYDDNGNRIYKEHGTTKELYLRDHTGQELAVFKISGSSDTLLFFNLHGSGLEGRVEQTWSWNYETEPPQIERNDEPYYYIKDHLGTIRVTLNKQGTVVFAADYWPYGEKMQEYVGGGNLGQKYVFTEKERDIETGYDYFGARFYDSDLGRWMTVDPLMDKYPGWSGYNYVMGNPLRLVDPDGMRIDLFLRGSNSNISEAFAELKKQTSLTLEIDNQGQIKAINEVGPLTEIDTKLLELINDSSVEVNLKISDIDLITSLDGIENTSIGAGLFDGNYRSGNNKIITSQWVTLSGMELVAKAGAGSLGQTILHEVFESYFGSAIEGAYSFQKYMSAHKASIQLLPLPPIKEIRDLNTGKFLGVRNAVTLKEAYLK